MPLSNIPYSVQKNSIYSYPVLYCILHVLVLHITVIKLFSYRLIRLTSPNLNYLIGVGAVVLYIDIYFFVIPSTDPVAVTVYCNVSSLYIAT